jgi:hypothetical protein
MTRIITNDNLYLLLPGKVTHFARLYSSEHNTTPLEALRTFYRSNTYKQLEREETKLWHYGPVALYEEFSDNH